MEKIKKWYLEQLNKHLSRVDIIPFSHLDSWYFDASSGNLRHVSGKFFSVVGVSIRVTRDNRLLKQWEQPIISQPEIGLLGFLTKRIAGERYFLIQAKMEPGNINVLQLSPTVQATKSNYTRVHGGKKTDYLNYFLDAPPSKILVDSLQIEHGGRFLQKRNRNIIVEVSEDIEPKDNFLWVSETEVNKLLKEDNFVNMNARSVFSCYLACNSLPGANPLNKTIDILDWITNIKTNNNLEIKFTPLASLANWEINDSEIRHRSNKYFSIIAVRAHTADREVIDWTQPMIKESHPGLNGFIIKKIKGVDHYLVQAKIEPGSLDVVDMAPTVQCSFSNIDKSVAYMSYFSDAKPEQIKYDAILSEEGGRFYHYQNRYMAVEVNDKIELFDNYMWVSYPQILEFVRYSLLNVESRTIIAGLNFGKEI